MKKQWRSGLCAEAMVEKSLQVVFPMKNWTASTVRFAALLFYGHLLLPTCGFAASSVAAQVSELLRQQIETWKTPPAPEPSPIVDGAEALSDANGTALNQNVEVSAPAAPPTEPPPIALPKEPPPKLTAGKETLRATIMLVRFYETRAYQPAWSHDQGPFAYSEDLINAIQSEAEREGLQPNDFRLAKLKKLLQEVKRQSLLDPRALTDLDLLLTDAFLTYAVRLSIGKVNLDSLDEQWFQKRQRPDLASVLQQAIQTQRIRAALENLAPPHSSYVKLRMALERYRVIAAQGGWPRIPTGYDLRPGDHDERVPRLRARLLVTGELPSAPATEISSTNHRKSEQARKDAADKSAEYDGALVQAVKRFQQRHGLAPDGVIGGGTLAALNVPVETRIQQIVVNLNRWRSLPLDLGPLHIDVNIPNFTLDVIERDRSALAMKVVVGKMIEKRTTPTFSANMTHVVLNPYWYVPKSIAEEELFPLSRKNPGYFSKHKFVVRRVAIGERQVADPNAMDGAATSAKVYQYFLRQEPGPKNALGRVKFMFPNGHGVYLHDTPSKDLFNRTVRTFSHGCIRVEKPVELAAHLLRESPKWTRDAILAAIERQKQQIVWLSSPVPVYIQYWTAWVDDEGAVQFRNDIYGYDNVPGARLSAATGKNPRPVPQPEVQPLPVETQSPAQPLPLPAQAPSEPQIVSPAEASP